MKYIKETILKDGRVCTIRNGIQSDGKNALDIFLLTHTQTDYLATYVDENTFTAEEESNWLQTKADSSNEIELIADINGIIVGLAGIEVVSPNAKLHHRASFGICVEKQYWGLGIGSAMTNACIDCAKEAGFTQLELEVVKDNTRAINMYKNLGFKVYGTNPKGFCKRDGVYQELVYMALNLEQ
ncbi:MAG: GNAT family N-acetyltransferase [Clostridiales bacterium]|nr:GNAT family N-acetyltransferase [Clostridiales bacterium]